MVEQLLGQLARWHDGVISEVIITQIGRASCRERVFRAV